MYQEYRPSIVLLPYIETYWTFDSFIEGEQTVRILPDGCVDILLNCNDTISNNGMYPFHPYIVGTMTSYSDVLYTRCMKMVGVRFKPGGITAFINVPIHELTNQRIDMSLLESIFDNTLFCDNIAIQNDVREVVNYIDSYLIGKLNRITIPDKQIMAAVDTIKYHKGCLPIKEVLEEVCLCQRQFERKFKSVIGITPKVFSSVVRFQNAQEVLQQHPKQSVFLTAIDCGYYDHAHFIREFKRFTGGSPKD